MSAEIGDNPYAYNSIFPRINLVQRNPTLGLDLGEIEELKASEESKEHVQDPLNNTESILEEELLEMT